VSIGEAKLNIVNFG